MERRVDEVVSQKLEGEDNREFTYVLDIPMVDDNFNEIDYDEDLIQFLSSEKFKTLHIHVLNDSMIPTAVTFGLKDHMFTNKCVTLSKSISGWKVVLSFLLSGYIDYVKIVD